MEAVCIHKGSSERCSYGVCHEVFIKYGAVVDISNLVGKFIGPENRTVRGESPMKKGLTVLPVIP
ncbi:hypothetical protein AGMMS50248_00980 [Deltaproteobacteria bacterium]|nr:hypothetical protein AGMMS49925_02830 [Deltaproteobacteria bacterium]GHU97270.1 hypothetical protein AGMMS50248_00980 [Deltaproteobacteria bacterium]